MSVRCKVCNASRVTNIKEPKLTWECKNCGNLLDNKGNINSDE